jgi:hypothetical protein
VRQGRAAQKARKEDLDENTIEHNDTDSSPGEAGRYSARPAIALGITFTRSAGMSLAANAVTLTAGGTLL